MFSEMANLVGREIRQYLFYVIVEFYFNAPQKPTFYSYNTKILDDARLVDSRLFLIHVYNVAKKQYQGLGGEHVLYFLKVLVIYSTIFFFFSYQFETCDHDIICLIKKLSFDEVQHLEFS